MIDLSCPVVDLTCITEQERGLQEAQQARADAEQAAASLQQQLAEQAQQHTAQQNAWHADRAALQHEVRLLQTEAAELKQQCSAASSTAAAAAEAHARDLADLQARVAEEQSGLADLSAARQELLRRVEAAEQGRQAAEGCLAQLEQQASADRAALLDLEVHFSTCPCSDSSSNTCI